MKFKAFYTDKKCYYQVGIDEATGEHVMEVVIRWSTWNPRYFRLTQEEVQRVEADCGSLAGIARGFAGSGAVSIDGDRRILSEKTEENEVRYRVVQEEQTKYKPQHPNTLPAPSRILGAIPTSNPR